MLKIEIVAQPSQVAGVDMGTQIEEALAAIGFARKVAEAALTPVQQSVRDGTFAVRSATDEERAAAGVEPGKRKRRTKAEIEADKAAEEKAPEVAEDTAPEPDEPELPLEDEISEQDAEDEQAESDAIVAARQEAGKPATLDEVRNAVAAYMTAFGGEAAAKDIPRLFADVFPAEKPTKLSELPKDVDLQPVVDHIAEATSKNPFDRKQVTKKG